MMTAKKLAEQLLALPPEQQELELLINHGGVGYIVGGAVSLATCEDGEIDYGSDEKDVVVISAVS